MSDIDSSSVPDFLSLLRLPGRGYIVLGAGQGIGRQTAHALAQAGATVLCVDTDPARAERVAAEVRGVALTADVTKRDDVERIFREARKRLKRLDGVVDIVGMAALKPLAAFDDTAWTAQFDIVLRHAFLTLQIGAAALRETGGGTLTFVGSIAGLRALRHEVAYGTAKAALHYLVRGMASELARDKIRVNAVAPGLTRTPRLEALLGRDQWKSVERAIPLGRAAEASEIAACLLFLASDLSSYISGEIMTVDAGLANEAALPPFELGSPKA
jgi:NAD(P)-dependent dehydrogenase (short-subunit alcohol dehydrogenase family)